MFQSLSDPIHYLGQVPAKAWCARNYSRKASQRLLSQLRDLPVSLFICPHLGDFLLNALIDINFRIVGYADVISSTLETQR